MPRIVPAVVRDGVVVVEIPLEVADGTPVRIVLPDIEEPLDLTPEQEADLRAGLAESERGDGIPWPELRKQLTRFE